jgi:hypothetical protein
VAEALPPYHHTHEHAVWSDDRIGRTGRHGTDPVKRIRSFREDDLPEVVRLYERGVRESTGPPPPGLESYFRHTLVEHPWVDPEIPSLVYEDAGGRVAGFIGSHVRRAIMDDRQIRLACSGQLVTAPEVRREGAGAMLMREYMAGPQEITITDGATEIVRLIWERLGGATLHLNCLDWVRVFRPAAVAAEYVCRHRAGGPPSPVLRVLAPLDGAVRRIPGTPLPAPPPPGSREELSPDALLTTLPDVARRFRLRLAYDPAYLDWLFRVMGTRDRQMLVRRLVRSDDGRPAGWYVLIATPGRVDSVVQLAAAERSVGLVLDHLFHEAMDRGASAVRGRVEAPLLAHVSERSCVFRYSGGALAHSRSREILECVLEGRALLTRMDGEWWMTHHSESFDDASATTGLPNDPPRGHVARER